MRTALAIEVGALLVADHDVGLVTEALGLWLEKPHLGPRALPSLLSEVLRRREAAVKPKALPRSTTADRQQPCFDRRSLYEEATANGHTSPAEQLAYVTARQAGAEPPPGPGLAPVIELPPGRTA